MESLTDVAALNNFATMIQEYLVQFKTNIISMASITDDSDSNPSLSPSLMGSDGFASGVFRINPEKFRVAKDSFTEWSEMLKANYDSYLSLQGYLSSDSYLNYAWGLACQTFDNLVKKRDNIDNWVEGFITNIVEIEASLPENVKGVSDVETTSFLQNHDYPTEPSFEDYKKSGQSGNISTSKSKNSSKKSSKKSSSNKYTNTSKKHSTGGGTTTTSSSSGVSGTTSKSGGSSKKTKINSKNTKTGYQNAIAKATKKAAKQAKDKKLKTNYQNAQASAKRTIQTKKAKTNYQNAQASVKKTVENKKIKTNYQNAQKKAITSTTARPTTTSAPTTTRQSWIKKTFFSPPKSGPSFAPGVAGGNR